MIECFFLVQLTHIVLDKLVITENRHSRCIGQGDEWHLLVCVGLSQCECVYIHAFKNFKHFDI